MLSNTRTDSPDVSDAEAAPHEVIVREGPAPGVSQPNPVSTDRPAAHDNANPQLSTSSPQQQEEENPRRGARGHLTRRARAEADQLASALAQNAVARDSVGIEMGSETLDLSELSTAPTRAGVPFYPTARTHLRLLEFRAKGPTDTWAALLVGLITLVVVIWGVVSLATMESSRNPYGYAYGGEEESIRKFGSTAFSICLLVALLAMTVLAGGVLLFPQYVLIGTAGIGSTVLIAACVLAFLRADLPAVFCILTILFFQFFYAFLNRHTLMRCTEALRTVGLVWRTYPAMVVAAYVTALLAVLFALVFSGVLIRYAVLLLTTGVHLVEFFVVWVFLMIFAWFVNIFPCLLSVIVGGVTATWYALEGDPTAGHDPPLYTSLNPTFWMTVRAFWTNCGTVCLVAALSVQSSCWHWLSEGLSQVSLAARCSCWQNCAGSLSALTESAYRSFNLYSLVRVATSGDDFIHAGPSAYQVVSRCQDLEYFRHRLHILTPMLGFYVASVGTLMLAVFGSLSFSLGCYALFATVMPLVTFIPLVHHTLRALLFCYALDKQCLARAAPALLLEIESVREDGERRFTDAAAERSAPVVVSMGEGV